MGVQEQNILQLLRVLGNKFSKVESFFLYVTGTSLLVITNYQRVCGFFIYYFFMEDHSSEIR